MLRHFNSVNSFTWKEPGISRDFARATAGELSPTITNVFRSLTM